MLPCSVIAFCFLVLAAAHLWSSLKMSQSLDRLTAAVAANTTATSVLDTAVTNLLADPSGTPPVATAADLDALSAQLEANNTAFNATVAKVVAATAPTIPAPPPAQ